MAVEPPTTRTSDETVAPIDAASFAPGERVGAFVLKEVLGEGGMGVVFLAEQLEPVRRIVALKLIRRQLQSPLAEAYFEVERQVLAQMSHPAIAKVFEAGTTPQGFPYFAMEWVGGGRLDEWHERERPSLAARLRMAAAVARGAQHAHQRGVIHRDLKPSNVLIEMVDGVAQPKIIDFGVAVGVGAGAHPEGASEAAGTGPFMSPEQARGGLARIDTRSDVYALGVVLLSLLLPPERLYPVLERLAGEGVALHDAIASSLASAPGARRDDAELDAIDDELRWLALRALQPDPELRYASAQALADEIERFLAARPLEAVPATRGYRLRKFVRRHRVPLAAGAAIVLALAAGLAAALYGMRRAEAEAAKSGTLAAFLSEVLSGVDPDRAQSMDKTLMRMVLDGAASRAQARLAGQPETLSAVESVIGRSYDGLGAHAEAIAFHKSAYERMVARTGASDPESLAYGRIYARTLGNAERIDEAETLIVALRARSASALGAANAETLRIDATYGWILRERGRLAEARGLLEKTWATQAQRSGADSDDALDTRYALAIVLADLGELAAAEQAYRALIDSRRASEGAESPRVLALTNSLGSLYLDAKRFAEAEALFRATLPLHVKVLGADSVSTIGVRGNLAAALVGLDRRDEARPLIEEVRAGLERVVGADHPWTIVALSDVGNDRLARGDAQGALEAQQQALDAGVRALGAESPTVVAVRGAWADAAVKLGRDAEARAQRELALAAARKIYPAGHPNVRALEAALAR